ncbi:hypothetical protein ACF0H5_020224 [Mactra antiquata]
MVDIKVLDGGTSEEISRNGYFSIYGDPLWSARLLLTDPGAILNAHKNFLEAGSEVVVTASYQASVPGLIQHLNVTEEKAIELIGQSVYIARQACKDVAEKNGCKPGLVAGSVGPYGACLHDGSEYTGKYMDNITTEELQVWHRPRLKALMEARPDFIAIETIPAQQEAEAIVSLIEKEFPDIKAWVTFACKNGEETCRGEKFVSAVKSICDSSNVIGVGVNCTSYEYVTSLLKSLQSLNLQKPIIVKPNSGELWDSGKGWYGREKSLLLSDYIEEWYKNGATWMGGCCRFYPDDIRSIVQKVKQMKQ